jgi:hypothetical protein
MDGKGNEYPQYFTKFVPKREMESDLGLKIPDFPVAPFPTKQRNKY